MRRAPAGGLVDRERRLRLTWDGEPLEALAGDTLASALLASGRGAVARSAVLGRPRGVLAAGGEEPNAWVQVEGPRPEPLVAATRVAAVDGLAARGLAGLGRLVPEAAAEPHEKRHAHCDVLVVGAGPAGLMAALAAARSGARTILADADALPGGDLLRTPRATLDGVPGAAWAAATLAEIDACPEARVLLRTDAVGAYDGNAVLLMERVADALGTGAAREALPRRRLWQVRARQLVLATGAFERPIVFPGNDRPGVMLAGAARAYATRWAVVPERAVVFTTTDAGHGAALDLAAAGVAVTAVVDARVDVAAEVRDAAASAGLEVLLGQGVAATHGDGGVEAVDVVPLGHFEGAPRRLECDLLAVSGGFDPVLDLHLQRGATTRFDQLLACLVPADPAPGVRLAGAARGGLGLDDCVREGAHAGASAARDAGFDAVEPDWPIADGHDGDALEPCWLVPAGDDAWGDAYVDLNRDVTVRDVARAVGAGLRHVEHVKRYTLAGTGADQGRTAKVNAAAVFAQLTGLPLEELATSSSRPPAQPVPFAVLAGGARGERFDPIRTTPLHAWHVARGAVFEDVGQWKRPRYYAPDGEPMGDALARECRAAREAVAMMDASTLGKIDVQGPDALELLERLYATDLASLAVGRGRYAVMCRADGMLYDDGVVIRRDESRFLVTTTTGNAASVLDWMEEWQQTEWPELRVWLTSVTEQWATAAVVGPRSRDVLATVAPDLAVGRDDFRFMAVREARIAGVDALVARVSFSGELAYEVWVPGDRALGVWEALWAAGEPHGIQPYGTESMHVLRAEKGYVIVGQETDGTVTPIDLGLDWLVSTRKPFVGRRSLRRADATRRGRKQLVALLPEDGEVVLAEGAQLTAAAAGRPPVAMLGHVTSSYHSATLGRSFALALLADGRERHGEVVYAHHLGAVHAARVADPVLYDPQGARRDGD